MLQTIINLIFVFFVVFMYVWLNIIKKKFIRLIYIVGILWTVIFERFFGSEINETFI